MIVQFIKLCTFMYEYISFDGIFQDLLVHTRNGLLSAKKVSIITIPYMSIIQKVFNSKEYLHPSFFESSTFRHDKMIIQLLAGQTTAPSFWLNFDSSLPATGAEVIVMGWGLADWNNQQLQSSRLLQVSIEVISSDACSNSKRFTVSSWLIPRQNI